MLLVVGAAVVRDGRVLACRRTSPPEAAGRWEFPGGKVEPGESPERALVRELHEELDVRAVVIGWLDGSAAIGDTHLLQVAVVTVDGDPEPVEHDAVRWLGPDELDQVDWLEPDRPFLAELGARLSAAALDGTDGRDESRVEGGARTDDGSSMQLIGFLGGMSWESTAEYYRLANEMVRDRRGGLRSARCVTYSVDFADIERMQVEGRWADAAAALVAAGRSLEASGADFLVLCTNTMHKVADELEKGVDLPLLHIGDTTAAAINSAGVRRVGLLGTGFTMAQPFYADRLRGAGLDVVLPSKADQAIVHRIIYDELCLGVIREESRNEYRRVIRGLVEHGSEGVIYGCTEIELLVGPEDSPVPTFPTTRLHVQAAVDRALAAETVRRPDLP